ncbi:zinc finger domain-containing protein [Streptomyces sp. GQFP]|uniref:zinc finger domain-containing protein n=1 Tax=Streptomyces sp. GQFP TaxID=2907545 RepID=UPI001F26FDFE|nr:cell surface glycoprotein [Streptomyces sp. GQFP]UIX33570.1 cell surface glycoprotein [Streptomyces sp. GQFP]
MDRHQVAALLAYADRLDPTRAPADKAAAGERLAQWADLLADVAPTAPHPEGRHWDASQAVRRHIATSPYPIKPSDVSRPWADFRRDVLSRHVDPVPDVDPDDQAAYRARLAAHRYAIETGQTSATPRAALTAGPAAEEVARRLAELGTYMPRTVAQQLATYRPRRAERERLAAENAPDPLTVACTWCNAGEGEPCRGRRINPKGGEIKYRRRAAAHHCRVEDATTTHRAPETAR